MDKCIESLEKTAMVSTLDTHSDNWQMKAEEIGREKTAFTPHHGLYRFAEMPFRLKYALRTFKRAIGVIL